MGFVVVATSLKLINQKTLEVNYDPEFLINFFFAVTKCQQR